MNGITQFAIKYRIPVCIVFLGITVFFGMQIPKVELDPGIKNMLPDTFPSRTTINRIEELFGGSEMIIVILDTDKGILNTNTLRRIKDLSRGMEEIPGIDKVMSLSTVNSINGKEGELIIKNLLKNVPNTDSGLTDLHMDIEQNPLIYGKIVTQDFTKTAIMGFLTADSDDTLIKENIIRLTDEFPGDELIHIGGMPYLRAVIASFMQGDLVKLMPLGLLIMLVFLFLCFHDLRGVILPFLIVIMSITFAFGCLKFLGWTIQIPLIIFPVILIAIANDYGIHLIARYQHEIRQIPDISSADKYTVIKRMNNSLGKPVFAAGLTTIAGFLTLNTHIVESAKRLGIVAGTGIAYALAGSILFIPAVLSILPLSKKRTTKTKTGFLVRILKNVGQFAVTRPGLTFLSSLGIVIAISFGMTRLVVDTSAIKFFSPESVVAVANRVIDESFGGNTSLALMAEGDIKSPEVMKEMDAIVNDMEQDEYIGNISSITSIIKQLNKILHHDDPAYYRIPDTRNEIAQLLELYTFGGDPEDFEKMVTFDYDKALITAQVSAPSVNMLSNKLNYFKTKADENEHFTLAGGVGEILYDLSMALVSGQIFSLILSIVLIGIITGLLFKSSVSGLLSILPITGSVLTLFGLMGLLNIELSTLTTMLTSIMIGAGVDYTIHFLWHYKAMIKKGMSVGDAIQDTLMTSGKAIIFNAFSVIIGFLPLLFSNFLPVKFFGFLITVSISTCLLGALVFLPSLLIVMSKISRVKIKTGQASAAVIKKYAIVIG